MLETLFCSNVYWIDSLLIALGKFFKVFRSRFHNRGDEALSTNLCKCLTLFSPADASFSSLVCFASDFVLLCLMILKFSNQTKSTGKVAINCGRHAIISLAFELQSLNGNIREHENDKRCARQILDFWRNLFASKLGNFSISNAFQNLCDLCAFLFV